ncbi:MAG: hypothetical protein HY076_08685, partial [Candidatus Eisenbacteria bacterium]|nr:hypothetical protein [Candidatus Eisenbacteria bacterium]
ALALALAAVLVSDRLGAWRVIAAALFGAAMFAKESVFFLPLVLLVPGGDDSRLGDRARRAAPLLIAGLIAAIVLLMSRAEAAHLGGEAYERAFGANILLNLTTYAHWAVDLHGVLPGQVSAIAAGAWPAGALVTLGLAVLAFAAWRRAPLAAFGAAWWLAALVPVLPLVHHTYLYYLYVPLAGLALALGGAIELARSWLTAAPGAGDRLRSPALAAIVLTLVATHALMSDRLLAERLALHMPGTGIPLDPDLRKSEMARHTAAGVAQGLAGERAGVAFILPSELSQVYSTATGAKQAPGLPDSVSYPMLEGALDGGAGLRVLVANVDSVAFLPGWKPGYGAFEMFSQSADGTVFPLGRGADGFASAGAAMRRSGDVAPAVRLLAGAVGEFPDVARLRYEYAHALYVIGDSLGSRRELTELLRRNPTDTLAARVRADFGRTQGAAARR